VKPALLTILLALTIPATAQAEWYFSRQGAEKMARDYAARKYGYDRADLAAACRPQGQRRDDPAYKYHRWTCGWAADDGCGGQVLIVGSREKGAYYGKVTSGMTCE
jgi:hypothetical protein